MRTKFKAWTVPYIEEHKEVMFDEEQLLNFNKPYYLEIGSGKGQFLVDMAKKVPDKFFVGIERNVTCCGFTAKKLVEEELPNAKLMFLTAELLIDKAVNLKPDSPKYNLSLVEIYYNTDRIMEAISCMEKVIKLRPTNTNYLFTLAKLYEEIWDIANAKKNYYTILEFEPSNEKAKKKLRQLTE